MKTVNEVINEVLESVGPHIELYDVIVEIRHFPEAIDEGYVAVSGDFCEDTDAVTVYLITDGNHEAEFDGNPHAISVLRHEIIKTIKHEDVHRTQASEGEDTTLDVGLSRAEYLMSPTEFEAYTLIDIPMDLDFYGSSHELDEYLELGAVTRQQFGV